MYNAYIFMIEIVKTYGLTNILIEVFSVWLGNKRIYKSF
jgi:hypothetical protein